VLHTAPSFEGNELSISSYLMRRSGRYYVRIRVPLDLVQAIGKKEIQKSLFTSDPNEARYKAPAVITSIRESFKKVQGRHKPTEADFIRYSKHFYDREVKIDLFERAAVHGDEDYIPVVALSKMSRQSGFEQDIRDHLASGETTLVEWAADEIIESDHLDCPRSSTHYGKLCQHLLRAWLESIKRSTERDSGTFDGTPTDPILLAINDDTNTSTQADTTLGAMLPSIHRELEIAEATKNEHRVAVNLFDEAVGQKPIKSITKQDIVHFKNILLDTPTNRKQRFPKMTLSEAIRSNNSLKEPFPTLGSNTINGKWLSHIRRLLEWCVENGKLEENPAFKVRVIKGKGHASTKPRHPFLLEELNLLFRHDQFSSLPKKGAEYWVLWIALYTGMRAGEIGQLKRQDITQVNGIWAFKIHTRGGKTIKTGESGARLIPMHSDLINLGLLDFILTIKNDARLFQDWKTDNKGRYSSTLPRWFNRTLLKSVGLNDPTLTFHSFRHTFKDACRNGGIPEQAHDQITGHSNGNNVGRGYGVGFSIDQLAKHLNQVDYGLGLGVTERSVKLSHK
jgi:integrase